MIQKKVNIAYEILLILQRKESHGREIAKKLNVSLTRVQRALKQLYDINAIDYSIEGKNHSYHIKRSMTARAFMMNAENYNLAKTLARKPLLEPILEEILKISKSRLVILFGSHAKGTENKNSDIDIYIENANSKEITVINKISHGLSVKTGSFDRKDPLIREIIMNHVIVRGVEDYYERTGFFERYEINNPP